MISVASKLYIMYWKSLILRRRNWRITVLECLFALAVVFCVYLMSSTKKDNNSDSNIIEFLIETPEKITNYKLSNGTFAYTPSNANTDNIMEVFVNTLKKRINSTSGSLDTYLLVKPFGSKAQLESWLREQSQQFEYEDVIFGIVFSEVSIENKTFKYELRAYDGNGIITHNTGIISSQKYVGSFFLGTQLLLDCTFLKFARIEVIQDVFIGILPTKTMFSVNDALLIFLYMFLSLVYVLLIIKVTQNVIHEKQTGIKEMIKITSVPSWIIWSHWLIYTLVVQLPLTIGVTAILTLLDPPVLKINAVLVWIVFVLFVINCTFLAFAASCLFSSSKRGSTIIAVGWIGLHYFTIDYITEDRGEFGLFFEVMLSVLLPLFNMVNGFRSILSFEQNGIEWNLGVLFTKGVSSSLSIGICIIIFLISSCLYAFVTMFLDAIHPGPFGVAKPINFMFVWCKQCLSKTTREFSSDVRYSLPKTYELPPQNAKVSIEIRKLHKSYGVCTKKVAVNNVDLDIYEGEIMALLGHNGAGKTTTMSMITGMFSPTSGSIRVDGKNIFSDTSQFRQSLGLCPQQNIYFPKLTVVEHLVFFAMLKGIPKSYAIVYSEQLLEILGLVGKKNTRVANLSGGMKRRLCLAISLTGDPRVLILDEPTSGLDPENRRIIWNLILGMRGKRTILITTHFMEEADVLGDRIAIMDKGQVVCCGTTMFLKKLYGAGYQVHLLTKVNASVNDISQFVNQYVKGERIAVHTVSATQVKFVLKDDNINYFPALFSALEGQLDSLRITGMSVNCATMEDVFLNVGNEVMNDDGPEERSNKRQTPSVSQTTLLENQNLEKLDGWYLFLQQTSTLVFKRLIYLRRNYISFLVVLLITSVLIGLLASLSIVTLKSDDVLLPLKIDLNLYPGLVTPIAYDISNADIANITANLIRKYNAQVELLPNVTNITSYAVKCAIDDIYEYQTKTLLAVSFNESNITVLYQGTRHFHLPVIAANLISNVLIQNSSSGQSGLIEITNHPYTPEQEAVCMHPLPEPMVEAFRWCLLLTVILMVVMLEFMPFVIDDRASGFKHQQFLAGVSPLLYWVAAFISDFLIYSFVIVVYLLIITVFSDVFLRSSEWMGLLLLVLFLHGMSGIFLVYLFCCLFNRTIGGISAFLMFNLAFGFIAAFIMIINLVSLDSRHWTTGVKITHSLLFLNPLFSVSMCIFYITQAAVIHTVCEVCKHCEKTENIVQMPTDENRQVILHYILSLSLVWIFLFAAILMIDYGFLRKMRMLLCYKRNMNQHREVQDDDVRKEIENVQMLLESEENNTPLIVDGLDMKYCCGPKAVNNVTFSVSLGECFGLLGVNGAGKTTTFKMITGEMTPNSGDAFILSDSVVKHRRRYMSHVGYCPQFDAQLTCLTGYETLWLMARLRGVRRGDVAAQINRGLTTLGFEEHAYKRSGTYSGGTKRKLSIAMALIGNPTVVFLDEPTTGVDPAARRKLWTVLQERQKAGQSIVLSSHSMEECEALCTRLTILVAGSMVCVGSCEHLKTKFNQGYTVLVKIANTATDKNRERLKQAFAAQFPLGEIKDEHQTLVQYQLMDPSLHLSALFAALLKLRTEQPAFEDFSVSNTSLEQLFLTFAKDGKGKHTK